MFEPSREAGTVLYCIIYKVKLPGVSYYAFDRLLLHAGSVALEAGKGATVKVLLSVSRGC